MNLVPFPRTPRPEDHTHEKLTRWNAGLHYIAPSYAPLVAMNSRGYSALTAAELTTSSMRRLRCFHI
jgi:hypothetical protein